MQPRKKLKSSAITSDMDPLPEEEDSFVLTRKTESGGSDLRGMGQQKKAAASKKPTAKAVPALQLQKREASSDDSRKPPAETKQAISMESVVSSSSAAAAPAPGHALPSHPQFPQIVKELQKQGVDDEGIEEIFKQLSDLKLKSEERLLDAVGAYRDRSSLMTMLNALGFRGLPVSDLANAVMNIRPLTGTEGQPSPREAYRPPLVQYSALAELFNQISALELKTVEDMFDLNRQNKLLGPFSPGHPTIPFFSEKEYPDLRFARIVPDTDQPHRTREGPELVKEDDAFLFRAISGGGKTSTIFDAGCVQPMIYVACHVQENIGDPQLEESATRDEVFPLLVQAIGTNCRARYDENKANLSELQEEGQRLIMVDICARLSFFLWLYETFDGITPENVVLAQLNGGRHYMMLAFEELRRAHRSTLDGLARHCRVTLFKRHQRIRLAIDEAQEAAKHCADERGFHFDHHGEKGLRTLLDEYVELWREYIPQVVVAGTGLSSDAAGHLPSSVGKAIVSPVKLPFLDKEDVKARLEMLLDVSDVDWRAVNDLHLITGRCRWVAVLVRTVMDVVGESRSRRRGQVWRGHKDKERILNEACWTSHNSWANKLAHDLALEINKAGRFAEVVERLCKTLHAVAWLFHDEAEGMHLLFDGRDTSDMLALGLVLLVRAGSEQEGKEETKSDSVERDTKDDEPQPEIGVIGSKTIVVMDKTGLEAVTRFGDARHWNPAADIAQRIGQATNTNAVEFGYKFETFVAAAISQYEGTVADLIRLADPRKYGPSGGDIGRASHHPPRWTETARFGRCKYRVCETVEELFQILEDCLAAYEEGGEIEPICLLIHPCNEMRHDYIAIMPADDGKPFLLTGSAKCWTKPLNGEAREDDFNSTIPDMAFMPKRGKKDTDALQRVRHAFADTRDRIKRVTGGRCLRLHVAFPGNLTKTQDEPLVKIEGSSSIGNESVRVIIDQSNYPALFRTPELRGVTERILTMKGYSSKASVRQMYPPQDFA